MGERSRYALRLPEGGLALGLAFYVMAAALVDVSGPSMADSALRTAVRLVEEGTLSLSDETDPQIVSRTQAFDISLGADGAVVSGVGPGLALVAAPLYLVLRPAFSLLDDDVVASPRMLQYYRRNATALGRPFDAHHRAVYLLQLAVVWLMVAPLFAWLAVRMRAELARRGVDLRLATAVVLAAGPGAMTLYYATMASRQGLACLLVWHGGLTLLGGGDPGDPRPSRARWVGGAALALAITIDYAAVLWVGLLACVAVPRLGARRSLPVMVPVALAGVALAVYHALVFGDPLSTPYHNRAWFPSARQIADGVDPARFERGGYAGMGLPSAKVAWSLCFGPYKGLFVYSPVLLLGAIGHGLGLVRRPGWIFHALCLGAFGVILAFNSGMAAHLPEEQARIVWGGLSILWGPRHLLPAVLPLALGLVALGGVDGDLVPWTRWPQARRRLVGLALGASIAANGLGVLFKQEIMATPALDEALEAPIAYGWQLLVRLGPRVTLLEAYGAPAWSQAGVLVALGVGVTALVRRSLTPRRS